jgi:hypothetical protein
MLVNSIPIYWGNPVVGNDFNTGSFVNVTDFKSVEEAIEYIIELDNNEEKYLEMASRPWFKDNRIDPQYSEESLLDQFDFIINDSKTRKPVAKSFYKKGYLQSYLKNRASSLLRRLKPF